MARIEIIGLADAIADLREAPGDIATRLMATIDRHLVARSPVDTGRFRANWNASNEVQQTDNVPEGEYSTPQVKTPGVWDKNAIIMWNTNNLQYAKPLADGHSPQAEAGWIETAIKAGIDEL